jgi:large subunit ribosomal protein L4e
MNMKTILFDVQGNKKGEIELPKVFATAFRPDLIKRAVLSMQSHNRQIYGPSILAGKKTSAHYHGVREGPHHMMNAEQARMSRIHGGPPFLAMTARIVPQSRKGRAAHPPKLGKIWDEKMNKKERVYAIRSAIAATAVREIVAKRGHKINDVSLPIVVDDAMESVKKAKLIEDFMEKVGLGLEIERAKTKKVRAGKGKGRGRRYKKKKSVLFVIVKNNGILNAAGNIAGADVCAVNNLNAELLAPGTHAGRIAVFTESAIKKLGEMYG